MVELIFYDHEGRFQDIWNSTENKYLDIIHDIHNIPNGIGAVRLWRRCWAANHAPVDINLI